ncbi:spore protein alpha/beta [Tumebacillus algifaecis]|uniref:Spore protein alpha/beta n=1 Tax=Tumebacillus algifaecis TaxID=1214604 RepID=A0A223CZJ1_9BACL|nr:alpha/beta-type small acid-soluble spore protein [Tumebacillus algifaecis]ASS74768.1 spore protein alpha/beta [Tumebacillus algifaecis]
MSNRRTVLKPSAQEALEHLKYEVAQELGLDDDIQQKGWGEMTTREVGKIGGGMVRKMIRFAEAEMAARDGQIDMSQPDQGGAS